MAGTFTVVRETSISAPSSVVFPLVNDLTAWVGWSPWEGLDDNIQRTYSESTVGEGASYHWNGNRKVGEGRMTITSSVENERVDFDLSFIRPMKSENVTTSTFSEAGGETTVRWEMRGPLTLFSKVIGIFFSMDKMIGKDFEKGLSQLKAAAEA